MGELPRGSVLPTFTHASIHSQSCDSLLPAGVHNPVFLSPCLRVEAERTEWLCDVINALIDASLGNWKQIGAERLKCGWDNWVTNF